MTGGTVPVYVVMNPRHKSDKTKETKGWKYFLPVAEVLRDQLHASLAASWTDPESHVTHRIAGVSLWDAYSYVRLYHPDWGSLDEAGIAAAWDAVDEMHLAVHTAVWATLQKWNKDHGEAPPALGEVTAADTATCAAGWQFSGSGGSWARYCPAACNCTTPGCHPASCPLQILATPAPAPAPPPTSTTASTTLAGAPASTAATTAATAIATVATVSTPVPVGEAPSATSSTTSALAGVTTSSTGSSPSSANASSFEQVVNGSVATTAFAFTDASSIPTTLKLQTGARGATAAVPTMPPATAALENDAKARKETMPAAGTLNTTATKVVATIAMPGSTVAAGTTPWAGDSDNSPRVDGSKGSGGGGTTVVLVVAVVVVVLLCLGASFGTVAALRSERRRGPADHAEKAASPSVYSNPEFQPSPGEAGAGHLFTRQDSVC